MTLRIFRQTAILTLAATTALLSGCLTQMSQGDSGINTALQLIKPGIAVSYVEPPVIIPSISDLYPELKM